MPRYEPFTLELWKAHPEWKVVLATLLQRYQELRDISYFPSSKEDKNFAGVNFEGTCLFLGCHHLAFELPDLSEDVPVRHEARMSAYRASEWHVVSFEQEGLMSRVSFGGAGAEKRAREYADWKNGAKHE
jgi:hypothetical protein